ncbi:copper homeostasis protein CutC [Asticcacaulis machinosus]|uniref:PF03932 family protein CutC n=1 Tax=Asticcacaulis machinosus TaxID=2984211 RepID=A0ABT5HKE0_9CAUL|nr:copper homeostasis protein CutC [Asticcacaulis machinosus]MDC7676714.1 copper homeostasis protein CutC [Asticcacaulis machinosus]
MTTIRLEICVDSPAGFIAAVEGGADRIELCLALGVGGLTPSPGLIELARLSPVPTRAMIRPRAGDFVYGRHDLDAMRRDIDAVHQAGLAGIVIGANRPDGHLDEATLMQLRHHASGLEIALHRAIDLTPDPVAAVDIAVELGFNSILTSGGGVSAVDGQSVISAMVERAAGRIEVMAGSGITPDNAAEIITTTGVRAIHASATVNIPAQDMKAVALGFVPSHIKTTDIQTVMRLRQIVTDRARVAA